MNVMRETCKNCGADYGLHQYGNNQCPRNGMESPVGRKQEWAATTFERDDSDRIKADIARAAYEQRMADARAAYDEAIVFEKSPQTYCALLNVFHDIAGADAERKT